MALSRSARRTCTPPPLNALNPPAPSQIAAAGWNIVGYLTAQDVPIPSRLAPDQKLRINQSKRVFYGFVAQNVARPTAFVAAICDAEAHVEQDHEPARSLGATTYQHATEGVEQLVGTGSIVMTGDSFGSALATYFTESLPPAGSERHSAFVRLAAHRRPRMGHDLGPEGERISAVQLHPRRRAARADGRSLRHALQSDRDPASRRASRHPPRSRLQSSSCSAIARWLDYADEQKAGPDPSSPPCILGPASSTRATTVAWALIVTEAGVATEKAKLLLKGLQRRTWPSGARYFVWLPTLSTARISRSSRCCA